MRFSITLLFFMYRQIVMLFLCCLPLAGQKVTVPLDESGKEGVLDVLFVTSLGESISSAPVLTVEKLVNGRLVANWKSGPRMKLNYGSYRLRASYPGSYPVEKIVEIHSEFQTTSICFFLSPVESPWDGNLIRGHISEKSRQNNCRWVRLISPFASSDGTFDAKATKNGDFAFENVRPGKYIAFTIGKTGICEVAGVTILLEAGKPVHNLVFPWTVFQLKEAKRFNTEVAH